MRKDENGARCHPGSAQADSSVLAGEYPGRRVARAERQWHPVLAASHEPVGSRGTMTWLTTLSGGVLIGLSATLLLWLNGRIAGVSGILAGLLFPKTGEVAWRAMFLLGLIAAAGLYMTLVPGALQPRTDHPRLGLVVAGVLVGLGTRMGNGCTSGHGVCGLSLFSLRSLAAVLTFMATAMATTFAVRHLWT
nr:YeeE/YedE family protein [Xanthomonas vesicatoria]